MYQQRDRLNAKQSKTLTRSLVGLRVDDRILNTVRQMWDMARILSYTVSQKTRPLLRFEITPTNCA